MLRLKIIEPVYIALLAFALFYIILLFVWAFGKPKARSLKNYASATLLMTLLVIILMAVVYFVVRDSDVVTQFISDFNEMFESLEMMY
jgi:predicted PurR-regulated permease PerM